MKTLEVYPAMLLVQFQQSFNELFPYLRVEPITATLLSGEATAALTVEALAGLHATELPAYGCFLVETDMLVSELEDNFRECFGLFVRVNRWTGFTWHDTDDTRYWTLEQQNRKGDDIARPGFASSANLNLYREAA